MPDSLTLIVLCKTPLVEAVLVIQLAKELLEIAGLVEVLVDRSETHIGDSVERFQTLHKHLANGIGGDFRFTQAFQLPDNARHHAFDAFGLEKFQPKTIAVFSLPNRFLVSSKIPLGNEAHLSAKQAKMTSFKYSETSA